MDQDRKTYREAARRAGKRLGWAALVLLSMGGGARLEAQAPHRVVENGRTIWTNDAPGEAAAAGSARAGASEKAAPSGLVYWSNVEKRWKPVPARRSKTMRSAEEVAGEVHNLIERRPAMQPGGSAVESSARSPEIDRYIEEASARHHVDPNLVRALVKVESNFNPKAVSRKGAMGLMQLMPATARRYDLANPFDARQNVDAGVRHLKGLLESFGGNVRLSLAAYNAGEGAVARSGGIPPYTETRNYVRRITSLMNDRELTASAGSLTLPIRVRRDERGRLVISNMD